MMTSDFRPEVEIRQFRACALKQCCINLIIAESAVHVYDGDVRLQPKVEMSQVRECVLKNMQCDPNLCMTESPKFPRHIENRDRGTRW